MHPSQIKILAAVVDSTDVASPSLTENVAGNLERDLCSTKIDWNLKDASKLRSIFENKQFWLLQCCLHC